MDCNSSVGNFEESKTTYYSLSVTLRLAVVVFLTAFFLYLKDEEGCILSNSSSVIKLYYVCTSFENIK